uniref:Hydroxysteroid 17-beta dehydrogenase 11 n=1 Tax=Glossina morsitans morsitans TaxID=37546 RepID=A0A1B0FKD8_GLOMM
MLEENNNQSHFHDNNINSRATNLRDEYHHIFNAPNSSDRLSDNINKKFNNKKIQVFHLRISKSKLLRYFNAFFEFWKFIFYCVGVIIQRFYYLAFGWPEKSLSTDIALITGGGNGLGRLLALRLCKMGAKVVIWDINKAGINKTVQMLEELGGYCKGYVVDISKREEVYKAAEEVKQDVGDINLLINNAGVVSGFNLLDTPDHLIERSFNVNVMAHFWTTKAFLPKMIENENGHIVTIASMAGHVGINKLVDYSASKFAAVGFDEALRLELEVLGHNNIKTTCICPFFIQQTGMFDNVWARWVSTLNPNEVADRIIIAIKRNEKLAIIPSFLRGLLILKWATPLACASAFLKCIVPDAAPQSRPQKSVLNMATNAAIASRVGVMSTFKENLSSLTNASSLLMQRSSSLGERVL